MSAAVDGGGEATNQHEKPAVIIAGDHTCGGAYDADKAAASLNAAREAAAANGYCATVIDCAKSDDPSRVKVEVWKAVTDLLDAKVPHRLLVFVGHGRRPAASRRAAPAAVDTGLVLAHEGKALKWDDVNSMLAAREFDGGEFTLLLCTSHAAAWQTAVGDAFDLRRSRVLGLLASRHMSVAVVPFPVPAFEEGSLRVGDAAGDFTHDAATIAEQVADGQAKLAAWREEEGEGQAGERDE